MQYRVVFMLEGRLQVRPGNLHNSQEYIKQLQPSIELGKVTHVHLQGFCRHCHEWVLVDDNGICKKCCLDEKGHVVPTESMLIAMLKATEGPHDKALALRV